MFRPTSSSSPSPVSTSEWMPSESIAELPVAAAPANFIAAMAAFAAIAPKTASFDSAMAETRSKRGTDPRPAPARQQPVGVERAALALVGPTFAADGDDDAPLPDAFTAAGRTQSAALVAGFGRAAARAAAPRARI